MLEESARKIAAAKKTALHNAAAKVKEGKQLTEAERKLCADNPEMFAAFLKPDDLDFYLFDIPKTEISSSKDKQNQDYPESLKEEPTINQTVLLDLATKVKAGFVLTVVEEKLCIDNFESLSKLFVLKEVNEYFWLTQRVAGEQLNKRLYEYWKKIDIDLRPQGELTPIDLSSEQWKRSDPPYQEAFNSKGPSNGVEVKTLVNVTPITKNEGEAKLKRSVYDFDGAKIRGWIFVIIIFLMLINTIFFGGKRTGCECNDGTNSSAIGSGACSHHGGVKHWKTKHLWD